MKIAMTALAAAGAAVSAYLTWVHYAEAEPFCTGISNCVKVQTSSYAEIEGVPVALLGLIGYCVILAVIWLEGELARLAVVVLCLTGFGFSLYLTYIELFEIEAICQWCVVSALLMTALAVLSVRIFTDAES